MPPDIDADVEVCSAGAPEITQARLGCPSRRVDIVSLNRQEYSCNVLSWPLRYSCGASAPLSGPMERSHRIFGRLHQMKGQQNASL